MSETEKKKRASYRKKRKIWIGVLAALVAIATLLTALFAITLYRLNDTLYINYTESGNVDYKVTLKPNDFYKDQVLAGGQAYVASLVEGITADFTYALDTETENVNYEYSYKIDTQLEIKDKNSDVAIFNPVYENKPLTTATQNSSNRLEIKEQVVIDYATYNELASRFIKTYELTNTKSSLIVRLHIKVLSVCDNFEENAQNEYVVSLHIPLTDKTVNIEMTSTVPSSESKILACEKEVNEAFYQKGTIITAGADFLLIVALLLFVFLTRNKDINYSIKVKRLLSAYRSFIQKVTNPFDTSGYQVLAISSFTEMLEIRDTISAPILMHENEDMTRTQFFIPTATKLLYLFEIKVADYDEIYGITAEKPAAEAPVIEAPVIEAPVIEAPVIEAPVVEEPVVDEPVAEEPMAEEPVAEEPVVEEPVIEEPVIEEPVIEEPVADADEENPAYSFGTKYDYSFEAKLALADDEIKGYYRKIVMFAKSYGVKVARSWARERIYLGRNLFALITFKGKKLALAFAMDPKTADPKYHAFDMSGSKKFDRTPMLMRVTSPRKLKFATDLLTDLFAGAGLADKKLAVEVDYEDHRTKEELLAAGLIRIEGMPAPKKEKAATPVIEISTPVVTEPVIETPEIIEEMPLNDEENEAYNFGTKYDYSFEAKLALADDEIKGYYRKIVMFAKSYGVKVARSWARERIYLGRNLFALITFKGKKLALAFAMDPKTADPKYHAFDMSGSKKFDRTPMLMRVTSPRKLKFATDLLTDLFAGAGLADKKLAVEVDYEGHRTKEELLEAGLIRIERT